MVVAFGSTEKDYTGKTSTRDGGFMAYLHDGQTSIGITKFLLR